MLKDVAIVSFSWCVATGITSVSKFESTTKLRHVTLMRGCRMHCSRPPAVISWQLLHCVAYFHYFEALQNSCFNNAMLDLNLPGAKLSFSHCSTRDIV